jgi:hypothetical protein
VARSISDVPALSGQHQEWRERERTIFLFRCCDAHTVAAEPTAIGVPARLPFAIPYVRHTERETAKP